MRRVQSNDHHGSSFTAMMERKPPGRFPKARDSSNPFSRHRPEPSTGVPSLPVITPIPESSDSFLGASPTNTHSSSQSGIKSFPKGNVGGLPSSPPYHSRSLNTLPGSTVAQRGHGFVSGPSSIHSSPSGGGVVVFDAHGEIQMKAPQPVDTPCSPSNWVSVGSSTGSGTASKGAPGPHTPPGARGNRDNTVEPATRPVPYTITKETSHGELVQIVKTLQAELDNRTTSVNAIQRNFERLGSMYQANQEELERVKEELAQCQMAAKCGGSETKLLSAMKEELRTLMENHEALRDETALERKAAEERRQTHEAAMRSATERIEAAEAAAEELRRRLQDHESAVEHLQRERELEEIETAQQLLKVEEETSRLAHQQRASVEKLLKAAVEAASHARYPASAPGAKKANLEIQTFLEMIRGANTNSDFILPAMEEKACAHAFRLSEQYGEVQEWVKSLTGLLTHFSGKVEYLLRCAVEKEKRWSDFAVQRFYEAEAWSRDQLFSVAAELRESTVRALEVHAVELLHQTTDRLHEMEREKEAVEREVLALQETTGQERHQMVSEYKTQADLLKDQLSVAQTNCRRTQQALEGCQREAEELHSLLSASQREIDQLKKREARMRQVQANQLQAYEIANKELLEKMQKEIWAKETQFKKELEEAKLQMREEVQTIESHCKEAVQAAEDEKRAQVVPLQRHVKELHETLVRVTSAVESSTRQALEKDEECCRTRLVAFMADVEHSITETRQSKYWSVSTEEMRTRSELERVEASEQGRISAQMVASAEKVSREAYWTRKAKEYFTAQESFRQSMAKKDREVAGLVDEHKKDIHHLENICRKQLAEVDEIQERCKALEMEVERKKGDLEAVHVEAFRVQKATLASIQRLMAVEESSESTYSCPACLQLFENPVTCIPCGHTFCERCIKNHKRNIPTKSVVAEEQHRNPDSFVPTPTEKPAIYCPECRLHCGQSLVTTRALVDLSSKFQYKKTILRDIATSLQRAAEQSNAPAAAPMAASPNMSIKSLMLGSSVVTS